MKILELFRIQNSVDWFSFMTKSLKITVILYKIKSNDKTQGRIRKYNWKPECRQKHIDERFCGRATFHNHLKGPNYAAPNSRDREWG